MTFRRVMFLFSFILISNLVLAQNKPAEAAAPQGEQPKVEMAPEHFKNIQILKDLKADDLVPSMRFMATSLGVECNFCHVQAKSGTSVEEQHAAFASDEKKEKQTARQMIQMMRQINSANFENRTEVTCATCHQGKANPQGTVNVQPTTARPTPPAPVDRASLPKAEELVQKYIAAVGGAEAWNAVQSRVMKGSSQQFGQTLPVEVDYKAPQKVIRNVKLQQGMLQRGYNGKDAWTIDPKGDVHLMRGFDVQQTATLAQFRLPLDLSSMAAKMRVVGKDKIDDKDVYIAIVRGPEATERLFFDAQSGLLLRRVIFLRTPLGAMQNELDFENYRDVGKVKVPSKITWAMADFRIVETFDDIQDNVPLDDAKFATPPAKPVQ